MIDPESSKSPRMPLSSATSAPPSPSSITRPDVSNPGVIGQPTYSFADEYSPMRMMQSA